MADSIHVKLPDGSVKEFPKGTTALDIAKSISPRLADAALVAKADGTLIDLIKPLEQDTICGFLPTRSGGPGSLSAFIRAFAGGCGARTFS